MSIFWKPIHSSGVDRRAPIKKLGNTFWQLWARCNVCCWTGPFERFFVMERKGESATVCDGCMGDEQNVQAFRELGWSIR
jgi:hypothetical protein